MSTGNARRFPTAGRINNPLEVPFIPNTTNLVAEPRGFSYACVPSAPVSFSFCNVSESPEYDYNVVIGNAVLCAGPTQADGFIAAPDFRLEARQEKLATFRKLSNLRPDADLRAAFMAGAMVGRRRGPIAHFVTIAVERTAPVLVYGQVAANVEPIFTRTALGYQRVMSGMWLIGDYYAPNDSSNVWMVSDRLFNMQFEKAGTATGGWQKLPLP